MINLYEVRFEFDNGSSMNVLMAAGSADEAKSFAHSTLRGASEPRNDGDVIRYNWKFDEITVRQIVITEEIPA